MWGPEDGVMLNQGLVHVPIVGDFGHHLQICVGDYFHIYIYMYIHIFIYPQSLGDVSFGHLPTPEPGFLAGIVIMGGKGSCQCNFQGQIKQNHYSDLSMKWVGFEALQP